MSTTAPTITKKAAREQRVAAIVPLLQFHDRDFYGRRLRERHVRVVIEEKGVSCAGLSLWRIARRPGVCSFWANPAVATGRRLPTRYSFHRDEWAAFRKWLIDHAGDIDPDLDTVESVARRMRHAGLSVNRWAASQALINQRIDLTNNPKERAK